MGESRLASQSDASWATHGRHVRVSNSRNERELATPKALHRKGRRGDGDEPRAKVNGAGYRKCGIQSIKDAGGPVANRRRTGRILDQRVTSYYPLRGVRENAIFANTPKT